MSNISGKGFIEIMHIFMMDEKDNDIRTEIINSAGISMTIIG